MALTQNQLWFPVTSLVQNVQRELKGGQKKREKPPAGGVKGIVRFPKIDGPFLFLNRDRTRDNGLNLMMQLYRLWELRSKIKSKNSFFCALNLTHRLIYVDVE